MTTKRMRMSIATGALLGVVCIVGAQLRSGFEREALYLFAFWYNRLLMGIVIGLAAGEVQLSKALGKGRCWAGWFPSPSNWWRRTSWATNGRMDHADRTVR